MKKSNFKLKLQIGIMGGAFVQNKGAFKSEYKIGQRLAEKKLHNSYWWNNWDL